MNARNISHNYYFLFSRIEYRMLMSICVFALIVGSSLIISLLDTSDGNRITLNSISPRGKLKLSLEEDRVNDPGENGLCGKSFQLQGLEKSYVTFSGFPYCHNETLQGIHLEFVDLDAKLFTKSLQGFTNIESITLHKVGLLNEDFERVYLPKLLEFNFDRTIGFHEQYKDYKNYTTPEKLLSTLFFDKIQNQEINLQDQILNSGVNITVRVDGWTVVASADDGSDLILALEYADAILKNSKTNYLSKKIKKLTLTECFIAETSIPRNADYINFYNVGVNDSNLSQVIGTMGNLKELFIEAPKTIVELQHIPPTIQKMSLSSINISIKEGGRKARNLTSIALGFMPDRILFENFNVLFPLVESVGIFEPGNQVQHLLLYNILQTHAKWVFIEKFQRKSITDLDGSLTPVEHDIEILLDTLELPPGNITFILEKKQDTWKGIILKETEIFKLRYKLLGWEKYITKEGYHEIKL